MTNHASFVILNTLLVFAWARSRLVHMCSWHSHVNGPCYAPNTGFGSPCNTCTVTVEIWVMNVLTMPLHLGHSDLPLATMLPPAGFVKTLTLPCFFDGCNNIREGLERLQHMRNDVTSLHQNRSKRCVAIGSTVFLVRLTRIFMSSVILLSASFFLRMSSLFSRTCHGKLFLVCFYRAEF